MAFARELYRAAQAGVQVFIIHGNHDPDEAWRADVPLPPSVYVFSSDKVESVPLLVGGETAAMVYGISYKIWHFDSERKTKISFLSACSIRNWAWQEVLMLPVRWMI